MPTESLIRPARGIASLTPVMVPIEVPPDEVCRALLRHATHPVALPEKALTSKRYLTGAWTAERPDERFYVVYRLVEGPLRHARLHFSIESDEAGYSIVWVTGEYATKHARLKGALERWQAQRDAGALRDGIIAGLKVHKDEGEAQDEVKPWVRGAERLDITAPARLFVAKRAWRAVVLNVSATGIALLTADAPDRIEEDARFMIEHGQGDVDILLHGENSRAHVLVRHAIPNQGGIQAGLHVLNPEATKPLLRQALLLHGRAVQGA